MVARDVLSRLEVSWETSMVGEFCWQLGLCDAVSVRVYPPRGDVAKMNQDDEEKLSSSSGNCQEEKEP